MWGLIVSGAGLAVISLVAPPSVDLPVVADVQAQDPGAAPADAAVVAAADPAVATVTLGKPSVTQKTGVTDPKAEPALAAPADPAVGTVTLKEAAAADPEAKDPAAAAPPVPAAGDDAAAAAEGAEAAAPLKLAKGPEVKPAAQGGLTLTPEAEARAAAPKGDKAPAAPKTEPAAPAAPSADPAPTPDTGTMPAPKQDTLLDPPAETQAPGSEQKTAMPGQESGSGQSLPQVPAKPSVPAAPEAGPTPAEKPQPLTVKPRGSEKLAPTPGLSKEVDGVVTDRLPRIGDAAPDADTAAEGEVLVLDPQAGLPIKAYARDFTAEAGKPKFAILLADIGAAGMARADLAKLPFAVTFVIDPAAPDAAEAVRAYRAAGQEVMILASGLPEGATAADLEQSFQALGQELPETVAYLDAAAGGLQENRLLATQAIPILKAQGRGIVTYDRGLGAADQVAQREGLAHATIFREMDAEGEKTPIIRRYLDRAAFKAAQEGQVVVIGQTRPDTVAAILEWMVEGRGSTVQLAPITAVMQGD